MAKGCGVRRYHVCKGSGALFHEGSGIRNLNDVAAGRKRKGIDFLGIRKRGAHPVIGRPHHRTVDRSLGRYFLGINPSAV